MAEPTLREQIDGAATLLLNKAQGLKATKDGVEVELMAESIKAFSAVVEWYKIRGGSAADEKPTESKFERLKRDFQGSPDGSAGKRGRAARKARASETDGFDDAEPVGSA